MYGDCISTVIDAGCGVGRDQSAVGYLDILFCRKPLQKGVVVEIGSEQERTVGITARMAAGRIVGFQDRPDSRTIATIFVAATVQRRLVLSVKPIRIFDGVPRERQPALPGARFTSVL